MFSRKKIDEEVKKQEDVLDRPSARNDHDGIYLNRQRVSLIVALSLLLNFFIFIGGYFFGQQKAIAQFSMEVDQESFADQIYASLYSMYDTKPEDDDEDNQAEAEKSDESSEGIIEVMVDDSQQEPLENTTLPTHQYYAELIGFAAEKSATTYAQKLRKKNIQVQVKKRESVTTQGKKVAWYQVVTTPTPSRDGLNLLIEKLKKEERLADVRIITC